MPHSTDTHAADADLRHEYARHAETIAVLRLRLREIEAHCGGAEPVGFCDVCGAALFPADNPVTSVGDRVTCSREAEIGVPAGLCYYRPTRSSGS